MNQILIILLSNKLKSNTRVINDKDNQIKNLKNKITKQQNKISSLKKNNKELQQSIIDLQKDNKQLKENTNEIKVIQKQHINYKLLFVLFGFILFTVYCIIKYLIMFNERIVY